MDVRALLSRGPAAPSSLREVARQREGRPPETCEGEGRTRTRRLAGISWRILLFPVALSCNLYDPGKVASSHAKHSQGPRCTRGTRTGRNSYRDVVLVRLLLLLLFASTVPGLSVLSGMLLDFQNHTRTQHQRWLSHTPRFAQFAQFAQKEGGGGGWEK
eukprot:2804258-Rhodomonas_salina.1